MVTANEAMVKKVIGLGLLAFTFTFLKAEINSPPTSKRNIWVDSVYSTLSENQKIKLLHFQEIDGSDSQVFDGIGGTIEINGPYENINTGVFPLIRGLGFKEEIFELLGLPGNLIACINDQNTLLQTGKTTGLLLKNRGYQFMLTNPSATKMSVQHHVALMTGINELGVSVWECKECKKVNNPFDGLSIESFIQKKGFVPDELSKSDIRKLRKELQYEKRLIYFLKDDEDQNQTLTQLADITILRKDFELQVEKFHELLRTKKIKKGDFEYRVKKILTLKHKILKGEVNKPGQKADRILIRKLWESGIVLAKDDQQLIPIKRLDDRSFASLSLGPFENEPFQQSLDHYTFFSHYGEADFIDNRDRLKTVLSYYNYVVVGFSFPNSADPNNADIFNRLEFIKELSLQTNVVVVIFADDKWLDSFDFSSTVLLTHCNYPDPLNVAPQIIFGALSAQGMIVSKDGSSIKGVETEAIDRLKYSFPENEGFDSELIQKIDLLIKGAIENQATPGCQVLVARNGDVVLEHAYGYFTYDSIQPVSTETIYDLASITKVIGTLQSTMFLQGMGALNVDHKISNYLQELIGTNKEDLIIRKILTHQAGLLPYFPFYKKTLTGDRLNPDYYKYHEEQEFNQAVAPGIYGHQALEDSIWRWTMESSLLKLEKDQDDYGYNYSDLGFLMMKKLNERLLNQPMEEFLDQNIYSPLGMSSTCYQPLCKFSLHEIAPTEVDYDFRNSLVWGLVHDENAALTGGVGGHAGLFSNANDLAILLQMNMQHGSYGGTRFFPEGTVSQFAEKQFPENRRGLGWDKPEYLDGSGNASKYSSRNTYGHLGFTGTAVWVDPDYNLIYIFLSNRVHPDRENNKLMMDNIRSRIQDIIYESMPEFRHDS
ncbi:MAG: serine hydrolase [Bacteroidetes bacterium]|nr:serine hydrolase [Bacteroidota bacterium]MDA1121422.1 serine hydrolase [Bacteroidota bacterium]